MKILKILMIWLLAFILTAGTAVYQRLTGPSYPKRGKVEIANETISYELLRSYTTGTDCPVEIEVKNAEIKGEIIWKRHKTDDDPTVSSLIFANGKLSGSFPSQPPAGKVDYEVRLSHDNKVVTIPEGGPAVIRYTGAVPGFVLTLHIFFMFFSMLYAFRLIIGVFTRDKLKLYAWITAIFLAVGGLILGPIVQYYAFGAFWTGWPFGEDLTDNKTLFAMIVWLIALWFMRGDSRKREKIWGLIASVFMLGIFMIPHSIRGSELDYSELENEPIIETIDSTTTVSHEDS